MSTFYTMSGSSPPDRTSTSDSPPASRPDKSRTKPLGTKFPVRQAAKTEAELRRLRDKLRAKRNA